MTSLDPLDSSDDRYQTEAGATSGLGRAFATARFYRRFITSVYRSSRQAKSGRYDDRQWATSSRRVMRDLEAVGVQFQIGGLNHLRQLDSPCVLVGNHMSMLETMVLPGIVQPILDVTFVVKKSLLEYPLFGHIMRSRNPVAVGRDNPREDLKTMMTDGGDRLASGISVIVFPQTTRATDFDASTFNSIGTKLASRNSVPVVPIALRTDAWGNGKRLKDFGRIDPGKTVHFEFGQPIDSSLPGGEVQSKVLGFIETKLGEFA